MKDKYKKILSIVGITVVVAVFGVLTMTYIFRVDSPSVQFVRKVLHLPAIIVDGKWISLSEIEKNTASIKQFYESQDFSTMGIRMDFSTGDGNKRLKMQERKMINKLIEDTAIEQMADKWNISISDEAVVTAMERPMEEVGSKEEVKEKLNNLYGWSLDDFGDKVVYSQLLREKVGERFEKENVISEEMTTKINNAKKELDDYRLFADVAKQYSDGDSAAEGGIMGWFADGQLQDEIGKRIFTMQEGEYTEVIETPLGLHIVKIDEFGEQDGQRYVHVSQIIIKKQLFVDYLIEAIEGMDVSVFLPQYKWDSESGMIVFSEDSMIKFEKDVYEDTEGTINELFNN